MRITNKQSVNKEKRNNETQKVKNNERRNRKNSEIKKKIE